MPPPNPHPEEGSESGSNTESRPTGPSLPRGHTFRKQASPKHTRLKSNAISPNMAPQPRAALPRPGTFKLARTGPPPPVGVVPAGSRDSPNEAADLQVKSQQKDMSGRGTARGSLPRGHTFRAPRRDMKEAARAVGVGSPDAFGAEGRKQGGFPRASTFAFGASAAPSAAAELERARTEARAQELAAAEDADLFRKEPSDVDLKDVLEGGKAVCGMCGNCAGGGMLDGGGSGGHSAPGSKASNMPPWAPERLALMTESERVVVLRKLQAKEELGRLDRELREKQLKDRIQREERMKQVGKDDAPIVVQEEDAHKAPVVSQEEPVCKVPGIGQEEPAPCAEAASISKISEASTTGKQLEEADISRDGVPSDCTGTLESDLEDEVSVRRGRVPRIPLGGVDVPSVATVPPAANDVDVPLDTVADTEHIRLGPNPTMPAVEGAGVGSNVHSPAYVDVEVTSAVGHDCLLGTEGSDGISPSCGHCELLEGKVRDLEEQLDVLRGVVSISSGHPGSNNGADVSDDGNVAKKSSWKSKVMSAYYGNGSSASLSERARLKEEVEALRKATDFLFARLQEADKPPQARSTSSTSDPQLD